MTTKSFFQAFSFKYLEVDEDSDCLVVGPVSNKSKQQSFLATKNRKTISLLGENISHVDDSEEKLCVLCPKLEDLDLADNKITSWVQITSMIQGCDNLRCLNVSENAIDPATSDSFLFPASLRVLVWQKSNVTWKDVCFLASLPFQHLEELHISFNDITEFDDETKWPELRLLNLYCNKLKSWTEILKFCSHSCPNLTKLMLGENDISSTIIENQEHVLQNLRALSLQKTKINSWTSLNPLSAFPVLTELRITEIPLFESLSSKSCRYLVLGRLKQITKLNGSLVTESERKDAEKYYLQQCYAEFIELDEDKRNEFLGENPRYNELLNCYGIPSLSGESDDPQTLAGGLIKLMLRGPDGKEIEKELPFTITVKNLKLIVNHLFKVRVTDQVLSFSSEDGEEIILDDFERSLHYYEIVAGTTILVHKN